MCYCLDKIAVFLIGAVVGSFLNVCIHRMPKDKSIAFPPSHCPKCDKGIYWYDNIPILSYLVLLGRCRFCREKISLRYPAVELLTALVLMTLFIAFGMTPKFFAYSIMTCVLIVVAFVDWETEEIDLNIPVGGIVASLALSFLFPSIMGSANRAHALLGSIVGTFSGGGIILVTKNLGNIMFKEKVKKLGLESAMGEGDIYLMAMIGSFLGWKMMLLTFVISAFLGSILGTILGIRDGSETIPYGPFLAASAIISVFFGNKILSLFSYGLF